jgi:hypothetical protein
VSTQSRLWKFGCPHRPGACAPGYTIPPHSGGSKITTNINGNAIISVSEQYQLFAAPVSFPSRPSDSSLIPADRLAVGERGLGRRQAGDGDTER